MVRHLTALCIAALFGIASIGCQPSETPVDEGGTDVVSPTEGTEGGAGADSNVTNGAAVETPTEESDVVEVPEAGTESE